jgi:hypothetical protein
MGLLIHKTSLFLASIDKFFCKNEGGGVLSLSQCRICSTLTEDSLFRCTHRFFTLFQCRTFSFDNKVEKMDTGVKYRERILTWMLYFFIIREVILEVRRHFSQCRGPPIPTEASYVNGRSFDALIHQQSLYNF